jgi:hypothetical protein
MIAKPLRLLQTGNDLNHFVDIKTDDGHGVVFELGHKKAIALEIDCEMVDAAANLAKRDFPFE